MNKDAQAFGTTWVLAAIIILAGSLGAYFMPLGLAVIDVGLWTFLAAFVLLSIYNNTKARGSHDSGGDELKSIILGIEDAIIVYDKDFAVTFFNASAEKLFGISEVTALGHKLSPRDVEMEGWRTLIQVIFPSLAPQVIPRSPEGQYPAVADISFTDPELELRVTTSPIFDGTHQAKAFVKVIRDCTPQIAALRSKEEFITVASHQLRGPVTDISWALESLGGATELSDTNKMIVENATAASKGLLRRIEDLLDVSKMEEGHFGYHFDETDISDFIGKTLADLLPAARKAGIRLYFDRPTGDMPKAMIDPQKLSMVLVNLVENAIRYNIENGEVIVKVEKVPDKPYVEVSVRDTGIGIPPEAIAKLFTKFFRAENAVKSQTEGSGIGLYIARGVVQAHGGEIWAESEINRGTIIHFTLPTDPSLLPKHEAAAGM